MCAIDSTLTNLYSEILAAMSNQVFSRSWKIHDVDAISQGRVFLRQSRFGLSDRFKV